MQKYFTLFIVLFTYKSMAAQSNGFDQLFLKGLGTSCGMKIDTTNSRGLLGFYKKNISSQDGEGCQFYPSCSVYMAVAIKKKGLFMGVLTGLDRITRCNGSNRQFYLAGPRDKLYDPVQ
jgi:putative component of membrane protein insertase Oxa1/YidC/SpoIIIJ protein YidD